MIHFCYVVLAGAIVAISSEQADAATFTFDATLDQYFFDEIFIDGGDSVSRYAPTDLVTDGSVAFGDLAPGQTVAGSLTTSTDSFGLVAELELGEEVFSPFFAALVGPATYSLSGGNIAIYYAITANLGPVDYTGGFPAEAFSIFYTDDDVHGASDAVYGDFSYHGVNAVFRVSNLVEVAPVPLPATLPLLALATALPFASARRRRG